VGWDKALVGLCVGAKAILTIPPELAYGSEGAGHGDIPVKRQRAEASNDGDPPPFPPPKGDKVAREVFSALYEVRTGGPGDETTSLRKTLIRRNYSRRCAEAYAELLGLTTSTDEEGEITVHRSGAVASERLEDRFHNVMSMPTRHRSPPKDTDATTSQGAKQPQEKYKPTGREATVRAAIMAGVEANTKEGANSAMEALESAVGDGTRVAQGSFNALLHLLSEQGSPAQIFKAHGAMRDAGVPESESTLALLVRALCEASDPAKAFQELQQGVEGPRKVSPKLRTYAPIVAAFSKEGDAERAHEVMAHARLAGLTPSQA